MTTVANPIVWCEEHKVQVRDCAQTEDVHDPRLKPRWDWEWFFPDGSSFMSCETFGTKLEACEDAVNNLIDDPEFKAAQP
jgi:hypothetical protein